MNRNIINGLILGLSTAVLAACGGTSDSASSGSKMLATTAACYTPWVSTTAYNGGATVSYANVNYTAAFWTQGQNPSTNNGPAGSGQPWISNGACGSTPTPTPAPTPTPTPTPTGPSGYTYCAGENGTCGFSGTHEVAYGANGTFTYRFLSNGTACNNTVFGDPLSGTAKSCFYNSNATTPPAGPSGSTFCSGENGVCSFSGAATVAYGANGTFVTKSVTGSTPCNNTTFGDPTPGTVKACYYTPASTTTGSLVFSAYKDVTVNADWNIDQMRTAVTGSIVPVTQAMSAKNTTLTWAFATGECGSENWAGMAPAQFASTNVSMFVNAGKKYIVSTGGAAGSFTCGTDSGFSTFVGRYNSASMIGVDFDIETGQTQAAIDSLVTRAKNWGGRASFTIATLAQNNGASSSAVDLGASSPDSLNATGAMVVNSIKSHGLTNYTVDLMAMDYGTGTGVCVMSGSTCQMGQSAIQAAMNLHGHYGIPYNHIEITPMNGTNDVAANVFSLSDAATLGSWARSNGIAGIHYWSMDRDSGLQYTNQFISSLGL